MICPYCGKPMRRFAEDTFYWYHRCKSEDCPRPEGEYMEPKTDEVRKRGAT